MTQVGDGDRWGQHSLLTRKSVRLGKRIRGFLTHGGYFGVPTALLEKLGEKLALSVAGVPQRLSIIAIFAVGRVITPRSTEGGGGPSNSLEDMSTSRFELRDDCRDVVVLFLKTE